MQISAGVAMRQPAEAGKLSIRKTSILMVDDRPDNMLAMESALAGLDQNLLKAHSAEEAMKYLLDQDVAVILLDVHMPRMDGFEMAALIRSRDKTRHTPIIFITAVSTLGTDVSRGYSLGAVDYIFKPYAPEILRTKVSTFVELFRKSNDDSEQFVRTASRNLQAPLRDISDLAQSLKRRLSARLDADAIQYVDEISEAADAMQKIIDGFGNGQI